MCSGTQGGFEFSRTGLTVRKGTCVAGILIYVSVALNLDVLQLLVDIVFRF